MPTKYVRIFPYNVLLSGVKNDVNTLKHIFAIKNVKANIVTFSDDYPLLLIIDQSENDFVFGRFIRLRKTSPPILDLDTATEREIELKISAVCCDL